MNFFGCIFSGLRAIVHSDVLIRSLARHELLRQGDRDMRRPNAFNVIRQKLRATANILAEARKIEADIRTMSDLLTPKHFNSAMGACRAISKKNEQMGLTIGGYLKHVILLKISAAIQTSSSDLQQEAEQFRYLMDAHFLSEVSAVAGKRQRLKRITKQEELPLHTDMNKLSDYLKDEIQKLVDPTDSLRLSKLAMAYLTLFNKRRPMEVAEITTQAYIEEALRNIDDNKEILDSLTYAERVMAKR